MKYKEWNIAKRELWNIYNIYEKKTKICKKGKKTEIKK